MGPMFDPIISNSSPDPTVTEFTGKPANLLDPMFDPIISNSSPDSTVTEFTGKPANLLDPMIDPIIFNSSPVRYYGISGTNFPYCSILCTGLDFSRLDSWSRNQPRVSEK